MLTFRRRRAPLKDEGGLSRSETPIVSVSPGLAGLVPFLAETLGPEHRVVVDDLDAAEVGIVGPVGERGVGFLKLRHPTPFLVVVDHQWAAGPERAAGYLDAGADRYLAAPSVREIAAHVRAILHRKAAGG